MYRNVVMVQGDSGKVNEGIAIKDDNITTIYHVRSGDYTKYNERYTNCHKNYGT